MARNGGAKKIAVNGVYLISVLRLKHFDLISDVLPFGRLWHTEVPPCIRSSIASGAAATDIGSGLKKSHLIVTESVAYGVQKFKANFVSRVRVALGRGVGIAGN
jgi:hypothetical protein